MRDTYRTENLHQKNGHQFPFKRKTSRGIFLTCLLCTTTLVPSGLGVPSQPTIGSTAMHWHWEMKIPIDKARCINLSRWSWGYPKFTSPILDLHHLPKQCQMIASESVQSKPTESSTTRTKQYLPTGNTATNHIGGTNNQPITRTG